MILFQTHLRAEMDFLTFPYRREGTIPIFNTDGLPIKNKALAGVNKRRGIKKKAIPGFKLQLGSGGGQRRVCDKA